MFYLSGMIHGKYLKRDIKNLVRDIFFTPVDNQRLDTSVCKNTARSLGETLTLICSSTELRTSQILN